MPKEIDQALRCLYQLPQAPEGFDSSWRAAVRREELMQMTNKRPVFQTLKRTLVPALTALVLVVGGLWAGTLDVQTPAKEQGPAMMRSKMAVEESASYDMAANTMMATSGGSAMDYGAPMRQEGRKIIRTADLSIATPDFDGIFQNAQGLAAEVGGYVENLYQYGEDGQRRATLSMRVPSEKLDGFLQQAGGMGRVTSRSESITDMTTQYVDNQARLDTLYAKRDRLNELLVKAENVSDLIEIETAIADTQYQIDSYETSQRSIDRQVDMSYVNLTIVEEAAADTAQADAPIGERLKAALAASIQWFGQFGRNVLVFVTMALPVIVPLAVIAAAVHFIRKRRKGK